jgi:hypothetical protein
MVPLHACLIWDMSQWGAACPATAAVVQKTGSDIFTYDCKPCHAGLQDQLTKQYAELIPSLADLARNLVRDLDPQVCGPH